MVRGEKRREQEKKEGGFHRVERSYGSFQRALNLPDDANQIRSRHRSRTGAHGHDRQARGQRAEAGTLDPDQRLTSPARSSQEKPGPRRGVAARDASSPQPFNLLRSISMARKQCRLRPTRYRAGGSQSQRSSQHHAVVRRPLPAISAPAKAHRFAAGSLVRFAQRLFRGLPRQ